MIHYSNQGPQRGPQADIADLADLDRASKCIEELRQAVATTTEQRDQARVALCLYLDQYGANDPADPREHRPETIAARKALALTPPRI